MAKLPVILEISDSYIRSLSFRSGIAGKTSVEFASEIYSPEDDKNISVFLEKHYGEEISGIYLVAPARHSYIRELSVPFLQRKKVEEVLPFELEATIPWSVSSTVYDFHFSPSVSGEESRVLVHGVQAQAAEKILGSLYDAGIPVLGIVSPLDSIAHLLQYLPGESTLTVYILRDIVYLIRQENHQIIFARVIPFGYNKILSSLAELWKDEALPEEILNNIPPLDEDSLKTWFRHNYSLSEPKVKQWKKVLEEYAKSLEREISLSLHSLGEEPEKLTIWAQSDLFSFELIAPYFSGQLSSISAFPIERTPLAQHRREEIFLLAGAMIASHRKSLNLLKGSMKKLVIRRKSAIPVATIVLFGIAALIFFLSFYLDFSGSQAALQAREKELEKFYADNFRGTGKPGKNLVESANKVLDLQKKKTEIYRKFFARPAVAETLIIINNSLQTVPGIVVENVNFSDNQYSMRAHVASFEDLNNLKSTLSQEKIFSEVSFSGERSMPTDSGNRVRFLLKLVTGEKS